MTRVIAGERKGQKLQAPPGKTIRPSTDRNKEWIFSVLYDVRNLNVLDIFCGAGNLGIESLSRGAAHCTFVDAYDRALQLTRQNIQITEYEEKSHVIKSDGLRFLNETNTAYDLILSDPPYQYPHISELIELAVNALTEPGRFFLETGEPYMGPLSDHITEIRRESMGKTTITIYGARV